MLKSSDKEGYSSRGPLNYCLYLLNALLSQGTQKTILCGSILFQVQYYQSFLRREAHFKGN